MRIALLSCSLAAALVAGCSASRGFCEASADCDAEIFGIAIDAAGDADDSVAVCSAEQDGRIAALRANAEEECQAVADALEVYFACVGNEYAGGEDGCDAVNDACDDEFEDVLDAQQEVNGDECTQNEE